MGCPDIYKEMKHVKEMELLYRQYKFVVYHYLYTLCKDVLLAEEITQETFFQIISRCSVDSCFVSERFFRKREPVESQICRLAGQLLSQEMARRSKELSEDEALSLEIERTSMEYLPEPYAMYMMELSEVHEKIKQMQNPMRKVICLRYYGSLTYKEVAKALNQSENWVKHVLRQGKAQLKQMLRW